MKKNKGFTMVELLTVIIILGVISTLAIAGVSGVLKKTKRNYLDTQNRMVVLAGKTYYSDHRSKLPKVIGPIHEVKLQTLIDLKYIDPVKDAEGNDCVISAEGKDSTVYVQKVSKEEYKYRGYLYCNGEESGTYDKTRPQVTLTPQQTITPSKIPLTITVKAEDDNEVLSYRYVIYKNDKEYKDTGYKNYKKKVEIVLKESGDYMIKAYAYDTAGNRGSTTGGVYQIRIEKPKCDNVIISAGGGINPLNDTNHGWTQQDITITASKGDSSIESWTLKDNGKTVIKKSTSASKKTKLTTEGKHTITFTGYNSEGKSCQAEQVSYGIDRTPPSLSVVLLGSKGGAYVPNTWYSGTVITTATGKDNLSPITMSYTVGGIDASRGTTATQETTTLSREIINEGSSSIKYKVVDDAGNSVTGTTYGIRLDRTPPTQPILSGNPGKWVNYSFSLSGQTTETLSGVAYWQYSYNQRDWTKYDNSATNIFTTTPFSLERNQNAYIRAIDNAGNISPSGSSLIQIDTTPPTVAFTTGSGPHKDSSGIKVYGDCSDSGSGVKEFTGNGAKVDSPTSGTTKKLTCTDNAGNKATAKRTFKVKAYGRSDSCGTESYQCGTKTVWKDMGWIGSADSNWVKDCKVRSDQHLYCPRTEPKYCSRNKECWHY